MTNEMREEIKETVDKLTNLCISTQIPMFLIYAEEKDTGTEYNHSVVTPIEAGVKLSEDKITKYSASLNKNLYLSFKGTGLEDMESGDMFDELVGLNDI